MRTTGHFPPRLPRSDRGSILPVMKVLLLATQPDLPETHLLLGLHAAGIDLTLVGEPGMARAEFFQEAGIPVIHREFRSRIDRSGIHFLREMLTSTNFSIAHTLMNRPLSNLLLAARGLPVRVVAYRGIVGNLPKWNPAAWLTYLNPRIDCVACVCDAIRTYLLQQGIPPHRVRRIYKGHDINWYAPAARAELCDRFGIPEDALIVSAAATMRPRKGTSLLLEAAASVAAGDRPVHLLLMGSVRDRSVIRDGLPDELGHRVHFTGHLPDAPRWAGASDVFVLPSLRREGLPKGVIEAMAQGVPAIVSDAGGSPELVRHERDGLVCKAGSRSELTEALNRTLNDSSQRTAWGVSARRRIQEDFNIQQTIADYLDLYQTLAQ